MSYLVLARKYRPQVFEDVVGQDHVTRTLANAIAGGRVAHAYLFCGPRGVGKTTAARILAKALNCEKGPAPVPCNECPPCLEITGGRSMDVLEIDGASNRGINEVRELRDNARYAPSGGRSKVYIIDEVHMLTHEAFNALLKTLEEPPPHVIFVLATTEPFKVPGTILSRCQRFDFARVPSREIAAHLSRLMEREGIEASEDALSLVARRAAGGVRDALSLMDQIISAADGAITRETVESILGLVGADFYDALTERLAAGDAAGALTLLDRIYTRGADLGELTEGLTGHLRDLLMLRIDPGLADILEASETEVPRLRAQAEAFAAETLTELVDRAADTSVVLRRSHHPRLTLELALAEMAQAAQRVPLADLAHRLLALEAALGEAPPSEPGSAAAARPAARRPAAPAPPAAKASPASPPAAPALRPGDAGGLWAEVVRCLSERSKRVWAVCHNARAVGFAPDGALILRAEGAGSILAPTLDDPDTRALLEAILTELDAGTLRVVLEGSAGAQAPAAADAPARTAPPRAAARPKAGTGGRARAKSASGSAPAAEGAASEASEERAEEPEEPPPAVAPPPPEPPAEDNRTMGELFKQEPMLQKALDMFDGEVLP